MHQSQHEMDEEGISSEYRRQLAENFFYKFFLHVALAVDPEQVAAANVSAANHHDRPLSLGDAGVHRVSGTLPRDASRSSSAPPSSRPPARSSTRRTCRCRPAVCTRRW